ncbi:hypothetical protein [Geoalkalibacter subterraneus]|uniref:Transposase n=1 Tax=Geoalkalibacter subterraneus TaxID=483547 RepID=A0A0B5FJ58_9BACT|nr:hypothetical protein [Geoalkalibacter subterraneus]AJF08217.1 hypothetical protein GSUB_17160 [Geoalkalibacter subterraneus]
MPEADKKPRECTDGDWPCEMSGHLCHLEAENYRLKSLLADLREWDEKQWTEHRRRGIPPEIRKRIHQLL